MTNLGLLIFCVNFLSQLHSLYFASYLLQPAYNGETSPNRHVLILAIWNGTVIEYHCVTADCVSVCVPRYCCRWIIKQSVSESCNLKRSSPPALPPQLISHLISTKIRLEKRGTAASPVCVCMSTRIAISTCTWTLVFVCNCVFLSFFLSLSLTHTQDKLSLHYHILTLSLPCSALFGFHSTNPDVWPYIQLSKWLIDFCSPISPSGPSSICSPVTLGCPCWIEG